MQRGLTHIEKSEVDSTVYPYSRKIRLYESCGTKWSTSQSKKSKAFCPCRVLRALAVHQYFPFALCSPLLTSRMRKIPRNYQIFFAFTTMRSSNVRQKNYPFASAPFLVQFFQHMTCISISRRFFPYASGRPKTTHVYSLSTRRSGIFNTETCMRG